MKVQVWREWNTNLCLSSYFFKEKLITIERPEQFDRNLLCYICYVFDDPSRDYSGHVYKVLCTLKSYIPETKDKLHLLFRALIGWAHLKPSQQKTPCPLYLTLGIAYYLQKIGRLDKRLAVLLMFDCHSTVQEIKSLTQRDVITEKAPQNTFHLLLPKTKTVANQSVCICYKTIQTLLLRHWWAVKTEKDRLLCLFCDRFGAQIHEIRRERFSLTDVRLAITMNCFRHGGATRDFMFARLLKDKLKDRGRLKKNTTLDTYVRSARSHIVQVAVEPSGRRLLDEIDKNDAKLFNVPEITTAWEVIIAKSWVVV